MFIQNMQKSELSAFIHAEVAAAFKKQKELFEVIAPKEESPWLTIAAMTILCGKSKATIHNWVKAGIIKPRKVGRSTYFIKSEVERLIS